MKILTSAQMRAIDRRAIEELGIQGIVLMENAALAVADAVTRHWPDAARIAIFCGTGNNGGDGFAVARHLHGRGLEPTIFLIGDRSRVSGDALANLGLADRIGVPIDFIEGIDELERAVLAATRSDLVIDAIFGTGLTRAAEGVQGDAIVAISALDVPVLSIDVPSGLDASSPRPIGPAVEADVTVTFAAPKIAHVFAPASASCGEVVVADIGIPEAAIEAEKGMLSITSATDVEPLFVPRAAETHKGTYGHVAIIAGSEGRSGAAILAARGAIRTGAGLVTVLTDASTAKIVDVASAESMSFAIGRNAAGIDRITGFLEGKSAVLAGPGLPDEDEAWEFVRQLLPQIAIPLVVDASALNAYAGAIEELAKAPSLRVITPHPGELGRLLGRPTAEIVDDRIGAARAAAERAGAVVVLKGNQTLVATPDGEVRVNPTGNAGMASGGMGDVLGGMIATLLAQEHDAAIAAAAAVWLHGFTGDLLAEETADIGLAARDLAEAIPRAIGNLRRQQAPGASRRH